MPPAAGRTSPARRRPETAADSTRHFAENSLHFPFRSWCGAALSKTPWAAAGRRLENMKKVALTADARTAPDASAVPMRPRWGTVRSEPARVFGSQHGSHRFALPRTFVTSGIKHSLCQTMRSTWKLATISGDKHVEWNCGLLRGRFVARGKTSPAGQIATATRQRDSRCGLHSNSSWFSCWRISPWPASTDIWPSAAK